MKRNGKATRQQLKRHNKQLILRAVYAKLADNRAALASETGLAKPTVSDIVSELIDAGFIEEGGHGQSTTSGGKRPRLLNFVPTARQVIGVTMNGNEVVGCVANLDGSIVTKHYIMPLEHPDTPLMTLLEYVINALIAQLDAPLICISVGVSGMVNNAKGVVISSQVLDWYNVPLSTHLSDHYDVPIYISNNTELATHAQVAYFNENVEQNLVTVLVNHTIEVGVAYGNRVFHHGGTIDGLRLSTGLRASSIGWKTIKARAEQLQTDHPDSLLAKQPFTYMYLRYAYNQGDVVAESLVNEIASLLGEIYSWIIGLMRPDKITLAGTLSYIGNPLINGMIACLGDSLPQHIIEATKFTFDEEINLSIMGAVANGLQKELGIL